MRCPNCGQAPPKTVLIPVGNRSNPYSLYFCADCKAIIEQRDGSLKVVES